MISNGFHIKRGFPIAIEFLISIWNPKVKSIDLHSDNKFYDPYNTASVYEFIEM
jgi:hypothetical protein